MAIQLNQINLQPLMQAAGNSTGNLGLKEYGLDLGAPAKGLADGGIAALELQYKYASLQNAQEVQAMHNQGLLDNTQLKAAYDARQQAIDLQFQAAKQDSINAINQQNANQQGMHWGNEDQLAQQQFGVNTAAKQQELAQKQ